MTYHSNFDVDAVMKTLGTVGAKYPEGTPEDEALRIASVASGNAKDGDLVKIADQGFVVYDMPKGLKFVPRPLPEALGPPDSK
jgi:hypothetical protein